MVRPSYYFCFSILVGTFCVLLFSFFFLGGSSDNPQGSYSPEKGGGGGKPLGADDEVKLYLCVFIFILFHCSLHRFCCYYFIYYDYFN